MLIFLSFLVVLLLTPAVPAWGDEASSAKQRLAPPPETSQLAPMLGTWRCVTQELQPDGSYVAGTATWKFSPILDGFAILDEWRAPKPDGTESVGINVRHFDVETGKWVAKWLSTSNMKWETFEATYQDGEFVMTGQMSGASGAVRHTRVTFYEMTGKTFKWKLDWSTDGGNTWVPNVYLIEGRRID